MAIFAAAPGETVPRDKLVGGDGPAGERTVDVQINRLRRKIEADPGQPALPADGARHRLPPGDQRSRAGRGE